MIENRILIQSQQGDYPVHFLREILELEKLLGTSQDELFIIADKNVWEIFNDSLTKIRYSHLLLLDSNEETKTMDGVTSVLSWLSQNGATKSSVILAIGGGVIQDLATFTSHIYFRGIKWRYVPTTLLSQADSCIGAKCGINLLSHKNQIGVLHSPSEVYVVEQFLKKLPIEELRSGFGEIYKLSVTGPGNFFEVLKKSLKNNGVSTNNIIDLIRLSLISKKHIIEEDEYEKNIRRILNYGHSFGHALESISKNAVTHGYGVLFGMDLINYLGVKWNLTPQDFYLEFKSLIRTFFSDYKIPVNVTAENLLKEVAKDKKILNGKMNFAVLVSPGNLMIVEKDLDDALATNISDYLLNESIFRTT
jgi:3-dehydroquinate synthase